MDRNAPEPLVLRGPVLRELVDPGGFGQAADGLLPVLNLVSDNTVAFFFDPVTQTTKANKYANSSTTATRRELRRWSRSSRCSRSGRPGRSSTPESAASTNDLHRDRQRVPRGRQSVLTTATPPTLRSWLGRRQRHRGHRRHRSTSGVTTSTSIDLYRQRTVLYPPRPPGCRTTRSGSWGTSSTRPRESLARPPQHLQQDIRRHHLPGSFTRYTTYKNRGMVFVGRQ